MLATWLLIYYTIHVYALSDRAGIIVAKYSELVSSDSFYDYLHKPLIITGSPIINWTLCESIDSIYDDTNMITNKQQIANCSCIEEQNIKINRSNHHKLCKELSSSFLYTADKPHYIHWRQFEATNDISNIYKKCLNISVESLPIRQAYEVIKLQLNSTIIDMESFLNHTDKFDDVKNQYKKFYSYMKVFDIEDETMDADVFEHIDLLPFIELFEIDTVSNVHLWFGTTYYRTIRHYDKTHNLFFMLKGSRTFRLSMPTTSMFRLFPFGHQSYRSHYPNYKILQNNNESYNYNYEIYDVEVYLNELLYIPGYWHHEVVNNNISLALSMWFKSEDQSHYETILDYELPINPNAQTMTYGYMCEFFYFIQNLMDKWCQKISKCDLFSKYKELYPVLENLNYFTFDWYVIGLDIGNILKCTATRIKHYDTISKLKYETYFCWNFDDHKEVYKEMWHKSIDDIIRMHLQYSHIGIADLQFIEYLETLLLTICGDINMIPIWIRLMLL
eukprot:517465_1